MLLANHSFFADSEPLAMFVNYFKNSMATDELSVQNLFYLYKAIRRFVNALTARLSAVHSVFASNFSPCIYLNCKQHWAP